MTISHRGRVLALTFLVALVAAGCGGNGNDASSPGGDTGSAATGGTATGASSSSGSSDGAGRYGGSGDQTGATGASGDDHGMDSGKPAGATVQANNFSFDPTDPKVESGEDLHLKNGNANTPHTFTIEGTDIDVELAPLASDEMKVDLDPGTYDFHCRFHSQMTGTLTVT